MKKVRSFMLCAILTGVGMLASSSKNPRCDNELEICPIGMTCINGECIGGDIGGSGDKIPCYSSLTEDEHRSEVDCSTCSRIFKQRPTLFATQSSCTTHDVQ